MTTTTVFFENCLVRLKNGDLLARDAMIERVSKRLVVLANRMLRRAPRVARWEQAEDLAQEALVRLHKCLGKLTPASAQEFLHLAALQLRRELCDMIRHHLGPQGHGRHHDSPIVGVIRVNDVAEMRDPLSVASSPDLLAIWTEFHTSIDKLDENDRRIFDLLWYHELTQAEVAEIMGISERQLRRQWQTARLNLQKRLTELGLGFEAGWSDGK